LCALGLAATTAVAAPAPVGPKKINPKDACTVAVPAKVQREFGAPVKPMRAGGIPARVCYFNVGADPTQAPGGILTAVIEYLKGDDSAPDAIGAVERDVDPDIAGGVIVEALIGLGKLAYLYPDDGAVLVAATKAFAFRLIWGPSGQTAALTPDVRKSLLRLAKDVVKRS
jgi:hypothetical protein